MSTRRKFLQQSGMLATASLLAPQLFGLDKKKQAVGLQLYTLRDQISKDPLGILQKIGAIGYREIEVYGYDKGKFFGLSVKDFSAKLSDLGLKSPSGHYLPANFLYESADSFDPEMKEMIQVAVEMKHQYLVIPWLLPEKRGGADQYKLLAQKLNRAGEWCKEAGLQLAYHNHDFEFAPLENTTGYEILIAETDAGLVKFETDLYWLVFAGINPTELLNRLKGRIPLWHVKDMSKTNRTQNTEVGNGSIDYNTLFKAGQALGMQHFFIEQENNYQPDPVGSVQKSFSYTKNKLVC